MDVENQEPTLSVGCKILSGDELSITGPLFTIDSDPVAKNCIFKLNGPLDYEQKNKYNMTVEVYHVNPSGRRKRQTYSKYTGRYPTGILNKMVSSNPLHTKLMMVKSFTYTYLQLIHVLHMQTHY